MTKKKLTNRHTSLIWNYFDLYENNEGVEYCKCKACNVVIKVFIILLFFLIINFSKKYHKSTTNLMRHTCPNRLNPNFSHSIDKVNDLLGLYFATSCTPINQLNNIYLKMLFNELGWISPCPDVLTKSILKNLVKRISFRINDKLRSCNILYLTMDLWSSYNSKFVGITGLWTDSTWKVEKVNLGMIPCQFDENYIISSDEIKRIFTEIYQLYGLQNKIGCVTIDNGKDVISFAEKIGLPFFRCGAHCMQLGINDAMENEFIKDLLKKIRVIAKSIKNSPKYKAVLTQCWAGYARMKKLEVPNYVQIPLSNKTRWNSTYYMLETFFSWVNLLSILLSIRSYI